jgi:hypothetical protein
MFCPNYAGFLHVIFVAVVMKFWIRVSVQRQFILPRIRMLTPAGLHNEVFWVVTSCGLVGGYQRYGGTASNFRVEVRHRIILLKVTAVTSPKIISAPAGEYLKTGYDNCLFNPSRFAAVLHRTLPIDRRQCVSSGRVSVSILYPFLTSAPNGGEWLDSRLGRSSAMETAPGTVVLAGWVGHRTSGDAVEKRNSQPLPGICSLCRVRFARTIVTIPTDLFLTLTVEWM